MDELRPGRGLALRTALARARPPAEPWDGTAELEARLRAALERVTALDVELEALSVALAEFSRRWERSLSRAFDEVAAAERLVRRLRELEDALRAEAVRIREARPQRRRRPARTRRTREAFAEGGRRGAARDGQVAGRAEVPGPEPEEADAAPEVEAAEVALKRLYRRLARLLHPDLAQDEAERRRLSDLMARVNAAYARGDLTELSMMAERVGAGEPLGELSAEERCAHLEARIANLERIAASLDRERSRLLASDAERLRAEAARRAGEGGDLVEETRAELGEEARAAHADALHRLERLSPAARELARARRARMRELVKRGPTGARRAFDPLAESELVRRGAARLLERRATAAARELARSLEEAARSAPWEVALTCLAFFAEAAGPRLPEALSTAEGWASTWDGLRVAWPAAPDLPQALARLPRHLVLGARAEGDEVLAGVQLASEDLAPGVGLALDHAAVAELAATVLRALGPRERCAGCRSAEPALHLQRTRGLDQLHGLVCGRCGAPLRSYWRYGELDGLEALSPHALRLGLVAEVTAALSGTAIGFQMLPAEAEGLTAERLRRRFAELYLAPYQVELKPAAVRVLSGKAPLRPSARVAGLKRLELDVAAGAGMTAPELLELLRGRIERRFRP